MKQEIKLIVTDLDGTFLNEDKKILPLHSLMAFTTGRDPDQHHLFYRRHPCIQRRASDNNGI